MYSQLLYTIVALLLFIIQQPGSQALRPPAQTFVLSAGVFLLYALICQAAFHRLRGAIERGLPTSAIALRYQRLQAQLSILALVALAVHVYVLNIKFYLQVLPGLEESLTLSGAAGLGFYLLHQAVAWFWGHPVYKKIHLSQMTRRAFLKGHLAFSSALLIPWLLISLVSDALQLLKTPAFFSTDLGQFLLMGMVLILFVLFAPWLVVRLWGCRTLPASPLRTELEAFCDRHHFRIGDFKLWPLFGGEMLTAGIMGILPRLRYILITQSLLTLLNVEELKAVIAHEMGHVRRYHLPFYLVFFLCYSALTYALNDVILLSLLRHPTFLAWSLTPDTLHLTLFSLVYSVPVLLLLVIYFRYIFGFFLRNSERQADLYAMQQIGHPLTLISSFQKIAFYSGHIEDVPSWHHFSIRQRIDFLIQAHDDPSVAKRHHRKLYGAALVFVAVVGGLTALSVKAENTSLMQRWHAELQLNILEHQLNRGGAGTAEAHAAYGGLLLEAGRFREAEDELRIALKLAPENAGILNNLAWLYATAPAPHRNAEAALALARKAAALDPAPHILDTLAEAYYVNGRYKEALEAIEKGLLKNPEDRDYFLRQKHKFEAAMGSLSATSEASDSHVGSSWSAHRRVSTITWTIPSASGRSLV